MAAVGTATAPSGAKTMSDEQGLEKAAPKTPSAITTPDEYRTALTRWQDRHFHVLTPFANISALAPAHAIYSSQVQINIDKTAQEVYDGLPFLKRGELAIAKRGLRKIAEGLGISTRLEYISVGIVQHYWHVKAIASYRGIDGAVVEREASQEWDLRDGSARLRGWQPGQLQEARKHGLRQCETRAINAAIRECGCGIKQAYSAEELAHPFVAVRVMVQPDMNNPEERRLVLERALGSTSALYPSRALPAPSDPFADEERPAAPVSVGSGSTAPSAGAPKGEEPKLPDGFGFIQKVEPTQVKRRDQKGSFTKWTVIDHAGVPHVTTNTAVGEGLDRCWKNQIAVSIESEENDYQENAISEWFKHDPAEPKLPGIDNL